MTTTTSKYQITLPKAVRQRLDIKRGTKFDIYPTKDGFIGRMKKKSKILSFFGDLKQHDDGKSLKDIREESQKRASLEINKFK